MTRGTMFCRAVLLLFVSLCCAAAGKPGSAAQIDLVSPCGGEKWAVGSRHNVIWKSAPRPDRGAVRIEYTVDGGKSWIEIAASAPEAEQFLWEIPDAVSNECKVRVFGKSPPANGESPAVFSIVPSREVSAYKWVNVTNEAAYAPRDGAGALVFDGKMWLLGGWNPGDKVHFPKICNNEVWSSTDGVTWTLVKPNTFTETGYDPELDWEGRHTAGYAVYKNKMWIVGGDANQGHYQHDVWNSDDGKTWTHVNKNKKVPWGPRVLHITMVFQDKIWIMGGQALPQFAPAEEAFYNDLWNTSDGVNWTRVVPEKPCWSPRGMFGGNVVFKDKIWFLGGGTYQTPKSSRNYYNDVWSSADGVHWQQHVQSAPWTPRLYHDVAVFDDRMWVLEGAKRKNQNDVWYSHDGVNWYELPNTPWKPRHAASVFVYDDALWMVAGNSMRKDVWKLPRPGAALPPTPP